MEFVLVRTEISEYTPPPNGRSSYSLVPIFVLTGEVKALAGVLFSIKKKFAVFFNNMFQWFTNISSLISLQQLDYDGLEISNL